MSGTAQPEDYLLVSIPKQTTSVSINSLQSYDEHDNNDGSNSFDSDILGICKNARLTASIDFFSHDRKSNSEDDEWHIAQMFNKYDLGFKLFSCLQFPQIISIILIYRSSHWTQNALTLPGNKVNISLETATNYAHDQNSNNFGFKCLVIGYDNPSLVNIFGY